MNQLSTEQFPEKDCTPKCRSQRHGKQILSCVTKGCSSEIRAYSNWLCHNFSAVTDEWGRNVLHLASSCGKWEIVEWLLDHCHTEVDVRDSESGWTALHRSCFYGQLSVARILLSHGANLRMTDHDRLTPLDLIIKDRLPYVEYLPGNPVEVYVWGSNINYNLGLGNEQSRANPEILEFFRKDSISIKKVVMCKFHSVFLSNNGKLYTCGHGHGGRLGQGSEDTVLCPSPVRGLGSVPCEQVAAGQDHLVLLMEGGQVWTCGLNTYHQLGHNPPPERLVTPKPISLKFLKGKEIVGVCAVRFHSVFYTKDSVFTFGLNAGQLGHPKGDRTQIVPRQVSALYNKDWQITHVAASDGATVCATNRGDVYVLHEYQQRKIASRQLEIHKLSVVGGVLDSKCDVAGVREGGGLELRVLLLTKSGKIFLWRQSNPYLRRCLFTSSEQLIISDIDLNHYTVAMVTHENKGFVGTILPFKERKVVPIRSAPSPPPISKSHNVSGQLNVLLDREDCDLIRVKRVPHIHRATAITCDSKGRNFAVLQSYPKMGLLDLPVVSRCEIQNHMARFLEEANPGDNFHDILLKVERREYPAHKYILSSNSEYFKKHLANATYSTQGKAVLTIENIKPDAFEQVLKFIYCYNCDFLVDGYEVKWGKDSEAIDTNRQMMEISNGNGKKLSAKEKQQNKKTSNGKAKGKDSIFDPLKCVQEASKRLNVHVLTKRLEEVKLVNGKIRINPTTNIPRLEFDRHNLSNLCDVNLRSKDGSVFPCHRCILAARLEYFNSMLGPCWSESTHLESLSLSISSEVMKVLLRYLYTDETAHVLGIEDADFLCQTLVIADELLAFRLKEMCELGLVDLLTLKNAPEILQISFVYNAVQLKRACMEYICINLPAIIEAKSLDVLSNEVMDELSRAYRQLIPSMQQRFITPNPSTPTRNELEDVENFFPVSKDCDIIRQKMDSSGIKCHESKSKMRRRLHSQQLETKDTFSDNRPRCYSESSEKDIELDITAVTGLEVEGVETNESQKKSSNRTTNHGAALPLTKKKPGQWIMPCPKLLEMPCLDKIMMKEKEGMNVLQKQVNANPETKRVFHMSQKQKKLLASSKETTSPIAAGNQSIKSPPCPWAKPMEGSPTSHSFWDAFEKGELQSASDLSCSPPGSSISWPASLATPIDLQTSAFSKNSSTAIEDVKPLVISLKAIQRAEEEELHRAVQPKIKPLQIINIEDQAIEELLIMYKALDNPKEKITVSRILPRIANPVWKKHA